MRIPFLPIALVSLGSSVFAHDEDNRYYAQLFVGGVFSDEVDSLLVSPSNPDGFSFDFDPGYSASAVVGRHFPFGDRCGLDVDIGPYYQFFTVDENDLVNITSAVDDDAAMLAWMVHGTLEYHFTPQFAIYGGGGVGYASSIDYDAVDSGGLQQNDDDGIAFDGRIGFLYNLGGSYDFTLGYRYFRTEAVEIEDTTEMVTDDIDIGQHVIEMGFRWAL